MRRESCGGAGAVGVVEAGQAVGDDLGGGAGGASAAASASAAALALAAAGGGGLGLGGGGSDGEIVLGCERAGGLGAGDDENLFQLDEVGGGLEADGGVGLVVGVGRDGLDGADGKAAGEDLVAAGGEDGLAGLDAGVGGEIGDLDLAGGGAVENGAECGCWRAGPRRRRSGR